MSHRAQLKGVRRTRGKHVKKRKNMEKKAEVK